MTLTLHCTEIFDGCPGVVHGETEDEVVRQAVEHAAQAHDVTEVDEATRSALVAAIRDE